MRICLPLILLFLGLLGWSLNGDIYRGFWTLTFDLSAMDQMVSGDIPSEEGIAPFETRIWIFVTLFSLILLSLTLVFIRIINPPRSPLIDHEIMSIDPWEREYGWEVAQSAHAMWARTVRDTNKKRVSVPPLNLLDLPLKGVLSIYRCIPVSRRKGRSKRLARTVEGVQETIWTVVMGALCFPLCLVDRLLGYV